MAGRFIKVYSTAISKETQVLNFLATVQFPGLLSVKGRENVCRRFGVGPDQLDHLIKKAEAGN